MIWNSHREGTTNFAFSLRSRSRMRKKKKRFLKSKSMCQFILICASYPYADSCVCTYPHAKWKFIIIFLLWCMQSVGRYLCNCILASIQFSYIIQYFFGLRKMAVRTATIFVSSRKFAAGCTNMVKWWYSHIRFFFYMSIGRDAYSSEVEIDFGMAPYAMIGLLIFIFSLLIPRI